MTWELTEVIEEEILSQLEGGVSLRAICLQDGMPSRSTVLKWQRENEDFSAKCVRAREAAGHMAVDELDTINQKVMEGSLDPQAARVVSSNLQWKASKLASKVYGDKSKVEHSGGLTLSSLVEGSLQPESKK